MDDHYEKRLEVLTNNAIADALPIYQPLIDELKKVVRSAGDLSAAKKAIEKLPHMPGVRQIPFEAHFRLARNWRRTRTQPYN